MTKSEMFKAAHKLAKTFVGNYRACFVMALAEVRENNLFAGKITKQGFSDFLFRGQKEIINSTEECERRFQLRSQGIDPDTMKRNCVKVEVSSNVILADWEIN